MTTNAAKRLDRVQKLIETLATRNKQHHFIVAGLGDIIDEMTDAMKANGKLNDGDDIQAIDIPWHITRILAGSSYIPEGNSADPLADPRDRSKNKRIEGDDVDQDRDDTPDMDSDETSRTPSNDPVDPPGPTPADLERWKKHVQDIERSGQRYDPKRPAY
jgi:hypothetical protein